MPTYPTPFLGGSEPPERDRGVHRDWAAPFSPGAEDESEAATPEEDHPAAEPEPAADEPVATESEATAAEPETSWAEPSVSDASVGTETDESGPAVVAAQQGESEYPEFLFGTDSPEATVRERPAPTPPAAAAAPQLADKAQDLLQGPLGDRIRRLIAQLSDRSAADAVSRAFAAGYLAAKSEEDD